jgi:hypothetical protein
MAIKAAGSVVLKEATAFLVAVRGLRAEAAFFTVVRCLPVFFATFFAVFFPAGRDLRVFDAFLATDFLETDFFLAAMGPPDDRRTLAPLPVLTTAKRHVAVGKPATLVNRELAGCASRRRDSSGRFPPFPPVSARPPPHAEIAVLLGS